MVGPVKNAERSPVENADAGIVASLYPEQNNPQKFGRDCDFGVAIV
jgi:hypothetical protein